MRTGTKKNLFLSACYSGVFILGMVIGPKFSRENRRPETSGSSLAGLNNEKMDKILHIIRDKYVDDIGLDTLQSGTIRDILKKLDPHSTYLPPENALLLDEDLEGSFNGIGISYYLLNDTLLVTSVNADGPSAHSGLLAGDRVLAINNTTVAGVGIGPKEITRLIRGVKGTSVSLLVKHAGVPADEKIRITRGKVTVSSIDAAYLPQPGTGYIKISRFGAKTCSDFITSITHMKKKGMKNLVLDLRGNGGGYLSAATALADEFLGDKKLIVYTEGQHEPRTEYLATPEGNFEQGKLIILIDENTASASEIVAGAVQDLDRGLIIGRRSFGKGLVQEQFPFGDGSALNLTIARYYTPSGRSIQRSYKNGTAAYYEEPVKRHGTDKELSERRTDSIYTKNRQYRTLSGRKVYGGGGIRPDVYVAPDTSGYNEFYYQLSASGFLNDYVYSKLARKEKPSSFNAFAKGFQIDNKSFNEFVRLAAEKGISSNDSILKVSRPVIATNMKAILALYYFGDDGYYRVMNERDPTLGKALELLR
jgi:carboxyl-terminal processing protease